MGFVDERQYKRFLQLCPVFEKFIVDGGTVLIKIWLEVGMEEQEKRFLARINDPMRQWKLSPMDLESYKHWYDYSKARDPHADGDRQQARALARRAHRRQAPRPAQLHRAHPVTHSL